MPRSSRPRASWRGFLRLSLVSCPVYLSPATTRTKPIRLHQVWQPPQRGRFSLAPVQVVSIVVAHHSGHLSTMEAEMRTMIATLAGLVALTSVSAQAVPLAPAKAIPVQFGAGPSIELARQGCGWGWHRGHWRDRWGWHWGRCYPNW
jgi:hypothetical protein